MLHANRLDPEREIAHPQSEEMSFDFSVTTVFHNRKHCAHPTKNRSRKEGLREKVVEGRDE